MSHARTQHDAAAQRSTTQRTTQPNAARLSTTQHDAGRRITTHAWGTYGNLWELMGTYGNARMNHSRVTHEPLTSHSRANLSKMGQSEPNEPNWAKLSQTVPNWAKLSQTEPNWAKLSQTEPDSAKLSHMSCEILLYVPCSTPMLHVLSPNSPLFSISSYPCKKYQQHSFSFPQFIKYNSK